ncbi:MAG: peptidoglycan DD-metalloendopeptidase family protein [Phycisphaerae bacterium]|nr:peptidoglycan DD-metalloendopeptidase family protein [Phycisphaerae bacterium]
MSTRQYHDRPRLRFVACALLAFTTVSAVHAADRGAPRGAPRHVTIGARAPITAHDAHDPGCGHACGRDCVPDAVRAEVRRAADANRARLGLLPVTCVGCNDEGGIAGLATPFLFYPMAGTIGADIMNGQFVDLDQTSPGFHDFECRPYTYDGHAGVDTGLRSFAEQFIGVPVFAARDGVVVFSQDGYPDTNLNGGEQGNIVAIDHGDGLETQYYHLKKDSVLVDVGETVKAGQEIARAASSGNSFGPHLHFGVVQNGPQGWTVLEPFAGPCRDGESMWADQAPLDSDAPFFADFGITRTDLSTISPPWWEPWPMPADAQLAVTDPAVVFWWNVYNFPTNALIRVQFVRPDGSIADDAQWNWGNTEVYRYFRNWFAWDIGFLGQQVGEWHLKFWLDGALMIDAPFLMTTSVNPNFNRAPAPIGAAFEPAAPGANDVVFCRVATTPLHEDPDWDVVRYRYVWRVNGTVVRDVTTAAQSDAIPHGLAPAGSRLCCTVTPSDESLSAAPATTSVLIGGTPLGDLTADGLVNGADLGTLLGTWGACSCCNADLNGDGNVDGADLATLLGNWTN